MRIFSVSFSVLSGSLLWDEKGGGMGGGSGDASSAGSTGDARSAGSTGGSEQK